jgi:hypothetical protein
MNWAELAVSPEGTHHQAPGGAPAYAERFDQVLKFHSPGLAPVLKQGRAWHIRWDGSPAYERRFTRTFGFYEGLAAVTDADNWHHVTSEGKDGYPERYGWCGNFQGSRCAVRDRGGAYLHINGAGRPIYSDRWRYAGDYRDGIAVVQASDGCSTHIDENGRLLHERWFVDLDVFHKGFARARDEAGWAHIDLRGQPIYGLRFAAIEPFYNGQARVERFDGGLEVIDEAGKTIVELRPARQSEFAALSGDMVGFWRTQTIASAVRLGVVEALPASEAAIAERCGLRPEGAARILRGLGELRLAEKRAQGWHLTPRGHFLRADHPLTLADAALEYAGPFSRMWEGLDEAIRAGSGWRAPDVFGEVAQDARRCESHHRMLRSYARHDYPEVARVLDLHGDEHVIDAGGGLGALARMVLDTHPRAHVTVLDRPEVVMQGGIAPGHQERLRWHAADLFGPWGLRADIVLLSRVLHDWDDPAAIRILSRAREVLPAGGRVFVVEMLIPEGSVAGGLCDLHLLMATGGRERSASELGGLLETAGFVLESVRSVAALPSIVTGVVR